VTIDFLLSTLLLDVIIYKESSEPLRDDNIHSEQGGGIQAFAVMTV
jgi:hypothetical protein